MPIRILLLLLVLTGTVRPVTAQNDARMRFVQWTYEDAGALLGAVGPRLPLFLVMGTGAGLAVLRLDEPLSEALQDTYGGAWGGYLDAVNGLGDTRVAPFAAAVFAGTLVTDDARLQDAAFTSLQALVYAGAFTGLLKDLIGRYRPDDEEGPYRFGAFSGHRSFPSGHTTGAFALVTPWVLYYPHPVTYGLLAVSASTAVARVVRARHWPTDVLAGGAIGFFTAQFLTRRHQQAEEPMAFSWAPFVGEGAVGVTVRLRLD